jgi:hypothetical protein
MMKRMDFVEVSCWNRKMGVSGHSDSVDLASIWSEFIGNLSAFAHSVQRIRNRERKDNSG